MVWPWLPLPFLLGSPSLLAAALAKSRSSCLSLPLLASWVVLPQHPECTMLTSFHLTRPLNNLFITCSSVTSLTVPCASCQDRKAKHWLERGRNSGPILAQFSSIQQTFSQRGPLKRALCQGLRTHSSLRHGSCLQRAPCFKGRQNLRMQGDDDGTWGNTGSAGGTAVPGVVGNSSFPEEVT